MTAQSSLDRGAWPDLPYEAWRDTCATLHLWTQIVGKVRLALTPWLNHSWHATFYVTARGLTSGLIPYRRGAVQIDFDFIDHQLVLATSGGTWRVLALRPRSVAAFHDEVMGALADLGVDVTISGKPNEVPDAIPFQEDRVHRAYDAAYVQRYWRALLSIDRVFEAFRTGFVGKASPVHLFWGAFDLAVTRFSGRPAPRHPGGTPNLPAAVEREAYSHEVSSAGFWPGAGVGAPMFYSYAYPEPTGFRRAAVKPAEAFYDEGLGEFLLPYAAVRAAGDPEATLLAFLQSTYEAAADLGGWDRAALESPIGQPGVPREV